MQNNIDTVIQDYPAITIAERSGNNKDVSAYLSLNKLNWPVVNDKDGQLGETYGVGGVPALFFINIRGDIVFTSVGYTSEWGLRFRLWLAKLL